MEDMELMFEILGPYFPYWEDTSIGGIFRRGVQFISLWGFMSGVYEKY